MRASVCMRVRVRVAWAGGGGASSGQHAETYDTRVPSKIHSLANLAAARATCQPAAAARRSQARRAAHPTQNAGVESSAASIDRLRCAATDVCGQKS